MKAILINGQPKYQSQFKTFTDDDGNTVATNGATEQQWIDWGFKEVVIPTITVYQKLGDWYETATEILRYVIDKTQEELDAELLNRQNNLVFKFERDTDNLIKTIVGERANEYQIAESEAIIFKDAGYPENDVPASISSDAIANNRTNIEACELILMMSVNWRNIQMTLRSKRLMSKAQTKSSITNEELDTIEEDWNNFIDYITTQVTE